jgi:hypothetical protein
MEKEKKTCPVAGGDDEKGEKSLENPSKRWMDGWMDCVLRYPEQVSCLF